MKIFSIKNERVSYFNRPIYCESENEALSYLQNVLSSDADRALHHLKDDLALYELGEIDFATGVITALEAPSLVCTLVDIFNTIPADRIPQTANELRENIKRLAERLDGIDECMKEVASHDDCKNCRNHRPLKS